ncbi:MAG: hypothetical protein ACLRWP_08920 [Bilophila wadsworthia]
MNFRVMVLRLAEVHGEGAAERGDDGVGVAAVGHDGALAGQLPELLAASRRIRRPARGCR